MYYSAKDGPLVLLLMLVSNKPFFRPENQFILAFRESKQCKYTMAMKQDCVKKVKSKKLNPELCSSTAVRRSKFCLADLVHRLGNVQSLPVVPYYPAY